MGMKRGSFVAERTGSPRSAETTTPETTEARHQRRYPIGAELLAGGGVHFRVWAPNSKHVSVELSPSNNPDHCEPVELSREKNGYFSGLVESAAAGLLYRFRLHDGSFPDPASRFQPDGPH